MMKMQQVMDTIIESSLNQFSAQPQLANLRESMREFFNKYMSWESLKGDMIQLYMDAYTQRELEDLIAFYETPTGKKSIALMPELAAKGAEIGQRRVGEHLPELKAMITARLREQRGGAAAPDAPPKGH